MNLVLVGGGGKEILIACFSSEFFSLQVTVLNASEELFHFSLLLEGFTLKLLCETKCPTLEY